MWERLRRPYDTVEMVDALLGLSPNTVRQLAGTMLATSGEAERLLEAMPQTVRSLTIATTSAADRCRGELRGPILWAETISARASSRGDPDLFVCATPQRGYDIVENRVLVAALGAIRDAARSVDSVSPLEYDDESLRRARHNGMRAVRYLEHRTLSGVARERPDGRMVRRARRGGRSRTYQPAVAMVDRAAEPLAPEDLLPFCDRRTVAQHRLLVAIADTLEARGATVPEFRADEGVLYSGPIRYIHPRTLGDRARLHGILLGRILVDVPEYLDAPGSARAQAGLEARSFGRPAVAVLDDADVARAVDLAIECSKG